jgi:hypothetical protein
MNFRKAIGSVAGSSLFVASLTILSACAPQKDPPVTSISWLAPQTRAALPPDCSIPILSSLPSVDYEQVALVEVTDDINADQSEVNSLVRRKACETGADALVILEDQSQKEGKAMPDSNRAVKTGASGEDEVDHAPDLGEAGHGGHYVDAVAIVYKHGATNVDAGKATE